MKSSNRRLPLFVGLASLGLACGTPTPSSPGEPRFSSTSRRAASDDLTAAVAFARAQTAFALSLLDELPRDENVVLGAYGLHPLLTMVALAGDEATEHATYAMLGLEGERAEIQQASNTLDQSLASRGAVRVENEPTPFVLRDERALFVMPDLPVRDALLDDLARWHGTGAHAIDLTIPEGIDAVNAWIDERTEGSIPEMLSGPLSSTTRATWVDATYFSAMWATPFSPELTVDQPFRTPEGQVVVPTMRGIAGRRFAEGAGWRAASLPYGGGEVEMWIVVPDAWESFRLDLAVLDTIAARFEPIEVIVELPRFSIEGSHALAPLLAARGLPIGGPWSRLSREATALDDIEQRTTLDVDELGTRAAAVTLVTVTAIGVPEMELLVVDRPFYFVIRDRPTRATLFVGRIVDPSPR